jgi:hypothetical protein
MPLNKDWREFIELLNSNGVEYLVVGAFALAFHGFPRYTADLDLLVRPTGENADRVLRALSEFGFGKVGAKVRYTLVVPGTWSREAYGNRSQDGRRRGTARHPSP